MEQASEREVVGIPGKWGIDDKPDSLALLFELGNGYAVTLSIRAGEPPIVCLWSGNQPRWFGSHTRSSFRDWLDELAFAGDEHIQGILEKWQQEPGALWTPTPSKQSKPPAPPSKRKRPDDPPCQLQLPL